MSQPSPPLEQAQELLERSQNAEKQLKNLQKILRDVVESPHDLRRAKQRAELLQGLELPAEWRPLAESLSRDLVEWLHHEERQRPLRFGRDLREAATAAGLPCEQLTSDPPILSLAPFTVELLYGRGLARLEYARVALADCPLEVDRILELHQRWVNELETPFDPGIFLEKVFRAYRRRLEVSGLPAGERVELVDILPDLTMLMQSEDFLREPSRENFRNYGKARLAYDLARLRRSGIMQYKGFRLTLGSATVGSTRDKSRVLFLEEGGKGQYFFTIWFTGTKT